MKLFYLCVIGCSLISGNQTFFKRRNIAVLSDVSHLPGKINSKNRVTLVKNGSFPYLIREKILRFFGGLGSQYAKTLGFNIYFLK